MILTGPEIIRQIEKGKIEIDPFVSEHVGANSVDLRLGPEIVTYDLSQGPLDTREEPITRETTIPPQGYLMYPGNLYLARTVEVIHSKWFVPLVEGRSSIGRLGVQVHMTAGFGDLGFRGTITLEMSVLHPTVIYAGDRICQVFFEAVQGERRFYQGRYQNQVLPTASRMHLKGFKPSGE